MQIWKTRLTNEQLQYVEYCEKFPNSFERRLIKQMSFILTDEENRQFTPNTDIHQREKKLVIDLT